jgi:cytochrome c-type biogenesis protein CcmH
MRALAAAIAVVLLAAAPAAIASEQHPTLAELSGEIMCPVCAGQTIDQSQSAIAQRIKRFISARIAAGDTKSEITSKLVAQFGEGILASPPKKGFNLLAWVLPVAGVVLGATVLGALVWRWSRKRGDEVQEAPPEPSSNGRRQLDPELERRLDEELARFDA